MLVGNLRPWNRGKKISQHPDPFIRYPARLQNSNIQNKYLGRHKILKYSIRNYMQLHAITLYILHSDISIPCIAVALPAAPGEESCVAVGGLMQGH